MNRFFIFLAISTAILFGCTNSEQFRVNGTIEGKPTMNMRIGYYADGVYNTMIIAAREGEFEFFGSSRQPTVVEILDYDYRPMGRVYIGNGQTVDCKLVRGNPFAIEATGNDITERWSEFLRANSDTLKMGGNHANAVIDRYIRNNPDNIISTLLLTTNYDSSSDPAEADSLLSVISPQARPSSLTESYNFILQRLVTETASAEVLPFKYISLSDSIRTFRPSAATYSVLCFDNGKNTRAAMKPSLERLWKKGKGGKLGILDMTTEAEKSSWQFESKRDSVSWPVGWTPGALSTLGIDRLAIPTVPFFVVCDSTGRQLLRTRSQERMEQYTDSLLKTL